VVFSRTRWRADFRKIDRRRQIRGQTFECRRVRIEVRFSLAGHAVVLRQLVPPYRRFFEFVAHVGRNDPIRRQVCGWTVGIRWLERRAAADGYDTSQSKNRYQTPRKHSLSLEFSHRRIIKKLEGAVA